MTKFFFAFILLFSGCASKHKCTAGVCENQHKSKDRYTYNYSCVNSAKECHKMAIERCPDGYRVINRVKGRASQDDTIYKVSILCRQNPYKNAYK